MAPCFKSTKALYNHTPKQVSILDRIQCIKVSSATLSMPRLPAAVAAANDSRNDGSGIRSMLLRLRCWPIVTVTDLWESEQRLVPSTAATTKRRRTRTMTTTTISPQLKTCYIPR